MTAVATAWAVPGVAGKQFRVSRESDSRVRITWLCGDVVEFSPVVLEEAVRNLRLTVPHGVWLRVTPDYSGNPFVVCVIDGELYADRDPADDPYNHVSWPAVEELIAPAPSDPEPPALEDDGMAVAPDYGSPSAFWNWLRRRAGR